MNGQTVKAINLPGLKCGYNWVNNIPAIGLPASGMGNISACVAINSGRVPLIATIRATPFPIGFAYIANSSSNTVSVINTLTNQVVTTIDMGESPWAVSASPDGQRVYISNRNLNTVSIVDTKTNSVLSTISVGLTPIGITVSNDGNTIYVANQNSGTISVINASTQMVTMTIPVGGMPSGVWLAPDASKAYVANLSTNTVSVIDTKTNTLA